MVYRPNVRSVSDVFNIKSGDEIDLTKLTAERKSYLRGWHLGCRETKSFFA